MCPRVPVRTSGLRLLGCAAAWAAATAVAAPPSPDYELLFAEEFDGPGVAAADWNFRTGPRTGTGIDGLNLARNVRIADGHLVIEAKHETVDGKPAHTGGGLISTHRFGYGYYEVRSQPFMRGRGVHTAFWQRGMGGPENNSIFEIDSHEIDSMQAIACNNLYVDVSDAGYLEQAWPHRGQVPFKLGPDGWWIDAYEYTPDGVVFYDQGRVVARADFPDLVAAQNVWLTALNGVGRVDVDKLPGETRFDYFRFYARDFPGANLLPNGGFEYNQNKVDLQRPIAWRESGDVAAAAVVRGGAAHGDFKLRHAADRPFAVQTVQSLAFIRNGDYEVRARVRRGGNLRTARLRVSGFGGADRVLDLPAGETWTDVRLEGIAVAEKRVTIALESAGGSGDWLEADEVMFLKPPLPGQAVRPSRSFAFKAGDPIWELAPRAPIAFSGDEKFYFFGRNVGRGDAITVSFVVRPEKLSDCFPLARLPKTEGAGWAVGLTSAGTVFLRLGHHARPVDVAAPAVLRAGVPVRVTCVYDRGTVSLYADGIRKKTADNAGPAPTDAATAGRLGANSGRYEAVGDVTLATGPAAHVQRYGNFAGELGQVRIYNRALAAEDVARLGPP